MDRLPRRTCSSCYYWESSASQPVDGFITAPCSQERDKINDLIVFRPKTAGDRCSNWKAKEDGKTYLEKLADERAG